MPPEGASTLSDEEAEKHSTVVCERDGGGVRYCEVAEEELLADADAEFQGVDRWVWPSTLEARLSFGHAVFNGFKAIAICESAP